MVAMNYIDCPKCGEKFLTLPEIGYEHCEKCRKKKNRTAMQVRSAQSILGRANFHDVELSTMDHTPEHIAQDIADHVLKIVLQEIGWAADSLAAHGAKTDADRFRRAFVADQ